MHRYWTTIVAPILTIARPHATVEIGAGDGIGTKRLLELTAAWGGTVHAIDPLPRFAVGDWEREYGARFRFHRDLSRNALPGIVRADAYLIDGDHNWYTVRQELELIERAAREAAGRPFPIVFLHATGWPYARRDLYRDPRSIPEAFVQRFRRAGVLPGRSELADGAGLRPEHNHSIREGEPRTGVLTALEDFLRESTLELAVFRAPAFNGLTVIVSPAVLAQSAELARLIGELRWTPLAAGVLEELEHGRVEADIATAAERRQRADDRAANVAELQGLASRHARELTDRARELRDLETRRARELKSLEGKKNREIRALDQRIAAVTANKDRLQRKLAEQKALAEFRARADARVSRHTFGRLVPDLVRAFLYARDRRSLRGLLDAGWYLRTYPDVAAGGFEPHDHYLRLGVFEGRDPGPDFSTTDYLLRNPDAVADGTNPLLHYARHGGREIRKAGPGVTGNGSPPRKAR